MYEIITTPGFVLSASPQGDADLYIKVYTKELGLIGAVVSGARKESSKHRFSLQPYSFISLSIVQGKHGYRVTGVEHSKHLFIGVEQTVGKTIARVTHLLTTLIHGSQKDEALYLLIESLFMYISEHQEESELLEVYALIRIVEHLGYFDQLAVEKAPESFFTEEHPSEESLAHISTHKHSYIQYINKSIFESQL